MKHCWRKVLSMESWRICGISAPQGLGSLVRLVTNFLMLISRPAIIGGMDTVVKKLLSSTSGKWILGSLLDTTSRSGRTGIRSKWRSKDPVCRCSAPNESSSQPITPSRSALDEMQCCATLSSDDLEEWISDWFPIHEQMGVL